MGHSPTLSRFHSLFIFPVSTMFVMVMKGSMGGSLDGGGERGGGYMKVLKGKKRGLWFLQCKFQFMALERGLEVRCGG